MSPVKQSASQSRAKATAKPKPKAKPAAKAKAKPAVKPKAKPAVKPKAKPAVKPKAKPAVKPKAKPAVKAKPAPKPLASPPVQAQPEVLDLVVQPAQVRERLDKVLTAVLAPRGLSRSRVQRIWDEGTVTVDGLPQPVRYRLRLGQTVQVTLPVEVSTEMKPADIALDILYEDKDLIVINKPAGLVTHPGAGHEDDTLANALLHHCGDSLAVIGGVRRPGIVHRLDKDTTGCMVAAKSEAAFIALQGMIARREVTRLYLALVWGDLREDSGTIDAPIGRGGDRKKMALRAEGKPAVTHFTVRERYAHAVELECKLETGRTHQIRAHLAGIGHGVVGDQTYGRIPAHLAPDLRAGLEGMRRQALHAWKLQFKHPISGRLIAVQAVEPADFRRTRELLKAAA
jgi:23S rRNA pseudouridine1911/1915/1917 synthase